MLVSVRQRTRGMSASGQSRRFDCVPPNSAPPPRQRTSPCRLDRSVSCQQRTADTCEAFRHLRLGARMDLWLYWALRAGLADLSQIKVEFQAGHILNVYGRCDAK
jgi:hypothetical protein